MNEAAVAYFAAGDYSNALTIFHENLTNNIKNKYHNETVTFLNNIGSTQFAQQNVQESLTTFCDILEIHRTYFIQHFNSQSPPPPPPPTSSKSNQILNEMKTALGTISHTLHNLAYVYAYMEDESMSSYFLETAVTINKTLKEVELEAEVAFQSSREEYEELIQEKVLSTSCDTVEI